MDCLDDDIQVVGHCNCIGCFDDSPAYGKNSAGSLIHGCTQREDELSSSLLAASCPLQSSQESQPLYWQLDTTPKKVMSQSRSVVAILFVSANLN
jgi:hypothetical protein